MYWLWSLPRDAGQGQSPPEPFPKASYHELQSNLKMTATMLGLEAPVRDQAVN